MFEQVVTQTDLLSHLAYSLDLPDENASIAQLKKCAIEIFYNLTMGSSQVCRTLIKPQYRLIE